MKRAMVAVVAAVMADCALAAGGVYGDTPDAKHAWAVHDWNRPKPSKVEPAARPGDPPSDAVVLFDGSKDSLEKNWCDKKGEATKWSYSADGYFYCQAGWKPNGGDIFTRAEFGDCQLHIEYRHDPDNLLNDKGPQMRGNSGIFLMGNYEIQVLESYYTSLEAKDRPGYVDNYADGQAGAVYAENPPLVNPARRPGEWQAYDIVFHQPIWKGETLVHPGSVTVFFNGVLVQDHWEMEGLTTHCKRRPLAPHPTTGKLRLQDHGCIVQYRNVWYRPLASRWSNLTHSTMSADEQEVMALRRRTAAALFAQVADPSAATAENVKKLAEVVSYANEGEYAACFQKALKAYRALKDRPADEVKGVEKVLDVLKRNHVIADPSAKPRAKIETSLGTIVIELDAEKAPLSVANFSRYAKDGHYDGTIFHRVIDGFMIQGGGFTADMAQKATREPIRNEAGNGLKNARGTIAMARTMIVDSATSQFFINLVDNAFLDHAGEDPRRFGYAVVGPVTEGMDVVDKIAAVQTGNCGPHQNVPLEPVVMRKVTVE